MQEKKMQAVFWKICVLEWFSAPYRTTHINWVVGQWISRGTIQHVQLYMAFHTSKESQKVFQMKWAYAVCHFNLCFCCNVEEEMVGCVEENLTESFFPQSHLQAPSGKCSTEVHEEGGMQVRSVLKLSIDSWRNIVVDECWRINQPNINLYNVFGWGCGGVFKERDQSYRLTVY